MALAALLVACVGLLRPTGVAEPFFERLDRDGYFREKLAWRGELEVVLAGDSRVYRNVVPSELSARLGSGRVGNFGFSGAGFSKAYLDAIAETLDPGSQRPTVVLGLSPASLTEAAAKDNGFTDAVAQREARTLLGLPALDPVARFFRPLDSVADVARFGSIEPPTIAPSPFVTHMDLGAYHEVPDRDGWVESWVDPPDDRHRDRNLKAFQGYFEAEKIGPERLADVEAFVRRCVAAGWTVVVFRPPTPPEMTALEDRLSGWPESRVKTTLTAAGAIWFEASAQPSYDGSHLTPQGARALSKELAAAIERAWSPIQKAAPSR